MKNRKSRKWWLTSSRSSLNINKTNFKDCFSPDKVYNVIHYHLFNKCLLSLYYVLRIVLSTGDTTVNNRKRCDSCLHGLQSKGEFHVLQIRCFSNINKTESLSGTAEWLGLGSLEKVWDAWFLLPEGCGLCLLPKKKGPPLNFPLKVLHNKTIMSF